MQQEEEDRKNASPLAEQNYELLAIVLVVIWGASQNLWLSRVDSTVKEPYLDEFFHVRQAKLYCAGNFSYWDPKITTPPGLYLVSYALHLLGRPSDLSALRKTNNDILALGVLLPLLFLFLKRLGAQGRLRIRWFNTRVDREVVKALHSAVNVCLFPPLFFFTALYYTDVASTGCVLWFLQLRQSSQLASRPLVRGWTLVLVGLISLCFRQTNIFWVAVFPAALDIVEKLDAASGRKSSELLKSSYKSVEYSVIIARSWHHGIVHDPFVNDAYIEGREVIPAYGSLCYIADEVADYLKLSLSVAIAAIGNPAIVLRSIIPYIFLLAVFGAFIVINGGVVLGDKANHIATLHTPQMLYIWPYIFFFSWQLLIPRVRAIISPAHLLPGVFKRFRPESHAKALPRLIPVICFVALALVAVHYNTIIHPFTLADNRHYVFYVFRLLLRHPAIKYLAAPVYMFCAWAALLALGLPAPTTTKTVESASLSETSRGCRTSYALIWLVSTTLCLVTAPLVEPRYAIIPWITWRLGVAYLPPENGSASSKANTKSKSLPAEQASDGPQSSWRNIKRLLYHGEPRIYVETAWFTLVNAATAYMFLYRGFEWPQEPGIVQRFMW